MKVAGIVFADFAATFLGGPSHLLTALDGVPVFLHTLRRLARTEGLDHRAVVVRPRDADAARAAIDEFGMRETWDVLALDSGIRTRPRSDRARTR